ncbi:hypothetical protein [Shimia aestuarii]|uniref:Uncharacterized protein n=1 Tax=Shimia aestuarii TaxID=254406 RepID=A0A1I4HRP1_9RHOB|nr:hypothetical protein [Shimia aestuarii]SFL44988.1 hypothetical protein SAMN04488042_101243 [Shimia aestuarii]
MSDTQLGYDPNEPATKGEVMHFVDRVGGVLSTQDAQINELSKAATTLNNGVNSHNTIIEQLMNTIRAQEDRIAALEAALAAPYYDKH